MPLTKKRLYRFPSSRSGPDLAAHLAALAEDLDVDVSTLAAAVGDAAAAAEGTVKTTDPRLLELSPVTQGEKLLAAITDASGFQTWLSARASDGGPTAWALKLLADRLGIDPAQGVRDVLFSVTDSAGRMTDLTVRASDGQFPDWVISRLRARLGVTSGAAPVFLKTDRYLRGGELLPVLADSARFAGWGSSSMEGLGSRFPAVLPAGSTFLRGGKGGERAAQTAARVGSIPALLTVTGGSIPAAVSPVAVTATNMENNSNLKAYEGTLAGVPGKVAWTGATYTFTRTDAGSAVTVPGPTPFFPPTPHRDAVTLLWMGKNNLGASATAGAEVIDLTSRTFDWLSPLVSRCLVLGHFMDRDHPATSLERTQLTAVNDAYRARYGDQFLDIQAYLTGPDIWTDTKITPTAADLAAQAAGNLAPSISGDSQHLNNAGYVAVSGLIRSRLSALSWI